MGLMEPYSLQDKEHYFFYCYSVQRTHVWCIREFITCGGKGPWNCAYSVFGLGVGCYIPFSLV